MDEASIGLDPGNDVLLLRSEFQRECENEFKSLAEETLITVHSPSLELEHCQDQSQKQNRPSNHNRNQTQDGDGALENCLDSDNGSTEDLTFDLANEDHEDNENCRSSCSAVHISSISKEFRCLLNQTDDDDNDNSVINQEDHGVSFPEPEIHITEIDSENLELNISTTDGHELVPEVSVAQSGSQPVLELVEVVESCLGISQDEDYHSPPLSVKSEQETEPEPESGLDSESKFYTAVFSCACCSKIAAYPRITEFSVSISNPASSSTYNDADFNANSHVDAGYNSNAGQQEQHRIQHSMSTKNVTVADALNLIFEYPVLFSIKPDSFSTASSIKTNHNHSIFCNQESHVNIPDNEQLDDYGYPLCQKCAASIHQLYVMYKEFTSLLKAEGKIIKTISAKLAALNNTDKNFFNDTTLPFNKNTKTKCKTQSKSKIAKKTKVQPQEKRIRVKKRTVQLPNDSQSKRERKEILVAKTILTSASSLVSGKTRKQKIKNIDVETLKCQIEPSFKEEYDTTHCLKKVQGSTGKANSNRDSTSSSRPKPKGRGKSNIAKTKTSNSNLLPGGCSSAVPKKRVRKSIQARKRENGNIFTVNYDLQNAANTGEPTVELLPKTEMFPADCDPNPTEIISEGDFFQVSDYKWSDLKPSKSISQSGRRKTSNSLFGNETKEKSKTTIIKSQSQSQPRNGSKTIKASGTTSLSGISSSKPTTPVKRIRNWKKESWIEKAQCDPSRTCDLCGKSFIFPAVMRRHKKIVHQGLKPYECVSCGKRFTQKVILNKHTCDFSKESGNRDFLQMTRESELRKFVCTVCGKRFKYPTHLNLHEMNHRDERPYPCSQCDKRFRRPDHLKYHVRIVHVEEKKFICTKCGQTFKSISSLRAHEKKHGSDQGHLCNICGKSIKSMYQMSRHQKTHQDELPFECPVCGKRFKMKDYLGQHLRRGKSCSKKLPSQPNNKAAIAILDIEPSNCVPLSVPVSVPVKVINPSSAIIHQHGNRLGPNSGFGPPNAVTLTAVEMLNPEIIATTRPVSVPVSVSSPSSTALNNIIFITTTDASALQRQHLQSQVYLEETSENESVSDPVQSQLSSEIEYACFETPTPNNSVDGNCIDTSDGTSLVTCPPNHNHNQNEDRSVSVAVVIDEELLTTL